MNTVFMIGNGFDLNLGFKTGYKDFYDHLFEKPLASSALERFKEYLKRNEETHGKDWADLEVLLGKYSLEFSADRAGDYIAFLDEIHEELRRYIASAAGELAVTDEAYIKFVSDLVHYDAYLSERDRVQFSAYRDGLPPANYCVSAIVFNYTKTFECFLQNKGEKEDLGEKTPRSGYRNLFTKAEHVHGYLDENMLLGVNDILQIENKELRQNSAVYTRLVKPWMNTYTGSLRDERCHTAIREADVICIFGMSMGKTDKVWWERVLRRLTESSARLIIFALNHVASSMGYLEELDRDEIRKRLLSYGKLSEEQKARVLDKIFFAFNSDIFKIERQQQKAG